MCKVTQFAFLLLLCKQFVILEWFLRTKFEFGKVGLTIVFNTIIKVCFNASLELLPHVICILSKWHTLLMEPTTKIAQKINDDCRQAIPKCCLFEDGIIKVDILCILGVFKVLHDVRVNLLDASYGHSGGNNQRILSLLSIIELHKFSSRSILNVPSRQLFILEHLLRLFLLLIVFHRLQSALGRTLRFYHLMVSTSVEEVLLLIAVFFFKLLVDFDFSYIFVEEFCLFGFFEAVVGAFATDELGQPVAFLGLHVDRLACREVVNWSHHFSLVHDVVLIFSHELTEVVETKFLISVVMVITLV